MASPKLLGTAKHEVYLLPKFKLVRESNSSFWTPAVQAACEATAVDMYGEDVYRPIARWIRERWRHLGLDITRCTSDRCMVVTKDICKGDSHVIRNQRYATICLGTDVDGRPVWEYMHRLACWVNHGYPNSEKYPVAMHMPHYTYNDRKESCKPCCENPFHVEWGEQGKNVKDGIEMRKRGGGRNKL